MAFESSSFCPIPNYSEGSHGTGDNLVDRRGLDCGLGGWSDHERWRIQRVGRYCAGNRGGIVGGWVVGLLGFGGGGLIWSILVAILGAVILIWITRLIKRVA